MPSSIGGTRKPYFATCHKASRRCKLDPEFVGILFSAPISGQHPQIGLAQLGARSVKSEIETNGRSLRLSIKASPSLCPNPRTYRNPRRNTILSFSRSRVQFHSDRVTSIGLTIKPCIWASLSNVAGE